MSSKVLIVPDKFKGTLTAREAARAMARGWKQFRPKDRIRLLPMSDGGDGFGCILGELLGAESRRSRVLDAAHRPASATWWWEPRTRTAIFDSASAIGLSKLPAGRFHPFDLDTSGLAGLFRAAKRAGARRCIVGLGGSATNDAGFGLAQALGWSFEDIHRRHIEKWTDLDRLDAVSGPERPTFFDEVIAAVDCRNPLLGPRGATRVYGPQKGLRASELGKAEGCHRRLARVGLNSRDHARLPGAGAAGGLGFALVSFLGARIEPGFELFARAAALDRHIREADIVITGEGCVDRSSFMGKGVGEIVKRARSAGVTSLVLAGQSALSIRDAIANAVNSLTETADCPSDDHARRLETLAAHVAREQRSRL
jgi:glycerate kinase